MTDSGAERAARLAELLLDIAYDSLFTHAQKMRHIQAAIIREETGTQCELFGRAMVIIKGLTLGTDWEIAPSIKREMEQLCADFEALAAAPDEGGKR